MRKPSKMRKPAATAMVSEKLLVESQEQLAEANKSLEFVRGINSRISERTQEIAKNSAVLQGALAVSRNTVISMERSRQTIVESLLQERSDLLSRLMRIDQRLQAAGVEVEIPAFDMVAEA